jgi:hypothetical protein
MCSTGDKSCEMSHIDHQIGACFVGDGAHAFEVELAGVGAASAYDHLGFLAEGEGFKLILINGFGVFADLVTDYSVEFA